MNAKSFTKLIASDPDNIDKYIGIYVDLMKKLHSTEADPEELPDMKAVAVDWVQYLKSYLDQPLWEKLYSLMCDIPVKHTMVHGDYHMGNIMMQNGEVLLIDMDTLSYGHPIFEFASMFLGYVAFGELDHSVTEKFLRLEYGKANYIFNKSLEMYFASENKEYIEKIIEKAKIIGYTRLMRRTIKRIGFEDEVGRKQIELCKERLSELIPMVDSLYF